VVGSLVFLTPVALVVAVTAVIPIAALVLGVRRAASARSVLGLPAPPPVRLLPKALLLASIPALLAVAAAQPAVRSQTSQRVRTDAQAMVVLDTSRSMLASKGPHGVQRITRAKNDAIAIRSALSQIPTGVATFTDRVLPSLLPDPDPAVFANTVKQAIAIEEPPPEDVNVTATDLGNLVQLQSGNFFPPSARKRVVIVLTDGESRPFDANAVARALGHAGIELVLVHVSAPGEQIYDAGTPEPGYHEDPTSGTILATLAQATGGTVVPEHDVGGAVRAAEKALGSGPTVVTGRTEHTRTIAPYVALLALIPLVLLAREGAWRRLAPAVAVLARSAPRPAIRRRGLPRLRHE
jgi:hypothetical protein